MKIEFHQTLSQFYLLSACLSCFIAYGCEKINNQRSESVAATTSAPTLTRVNNAAPSKKNTTAFQKNSENRAKNLILFIGDGMGISTITAGRIFDGQALGKKGEEHSLAFEDFDNVALVKTYNYDAQVPDSAGTATAIMSGYKARIGTLNVPPHDLLAGCGARPAPPTLAKRAADKGLSVGIVATARITHATPAAMFAHSASRDWEANKDIKGVAAQSGCRSIAAQLIDPASHINLALGGGAKEFTKAQLKDWNRQSENHITLSKGAQLSALSPADGQDVLGLFSTSHMAYEADRSKTDQPSLADMTRFAISNLSARERGYVLMVEAGRIDHAHHAGNAYRAMRDMQALNEAVKTAIAQTGDETTILVTADHSHVFTIAGYPKRGNPILGLVERPAGLEDLLSGADAETKTELAGDGKPYTTLGYHNGPGPLRHTHGPLTSNIVQSPDFQQEAAVPLQSETHAGEDVAIYATGPGAHRIRGVMEQNEISDVIDAALGLR